MPEAPTIKSATLIALELSARRRPTPPADRLTIALFLVGLIHALLILGLTFTASTRHAPTAPSVQVLIVQNPQKSTSRNDPSTYVAQVTQRGGVKDKVDTSTDRDAIPLPESAPEEDTNSQANDDAPPAIRADSVDRVVETHSPATHPVAQGADATQATPKADLVMQHLAAHTEMRPPETSPSLKGPVRRELKVTADTRESSAAVYLDAWRHRIESLGTMNYPMQAARKRHGFGNPIVDVQILANGSLGEARIERSSGSPELDQAALGILHLAAPFPAFPSELQQKHDALRLSYEWQFEDGATMKISVPTGH